MVVGVVATFRIILSVPVVGVAGCDVVGGILMIAYCQMQGVCAWAVVCVDVVESICAGFRI